MARQRLPNGFAWFQFIFRIISLVACHGCLLTNIYILHTFHRSNALVYFATLWTLIIDNAEILALYSKPGDGIWRFRFWPLFTWEVSGVLLYLGSAFMTFESDNMRQMDRGPESGINYEIAKWFLIFCIMSLHIFLIITCGIDSFLHRQARSREPGRAWVENGF